MADEDSVTINATRIVESLFINPVSKKESQQVEFKENIQNELFVRYAKSLASFANNKGGMIIFGVKNSPHVPVGTETHNNFNRDRLGRIFEKFFSPLIDWQMVVLKINNLNFPVLYVTRNQGEIYVCLEEHNGENLHKGDVFFRYNSENKKILPNELHRLIQDIRDNERNTVISKMNVIANSNPRDLLIANLAEKTLPELGGKLVIDETVAKDLRFVKEGHFKEKGKPVFQIVSRVQPIKVRPVRKGKGSVNVELTEQNYRDFFPYTHDEMVEIIKSKVTGFVQNPDFNKAKLSLRKNRENELAYHRTLRSSNETGMWFYNDDYIDELVKILASEPSS